MNRQEGPSRNEDEYFVKHDAELIKQRRAELDAERQRREREAHKMHCPKCGAHLSEFEFQHVKMDKCADCGGVWLDQGELEMLTHTEESNLRRVVRDMLSVRFR
jgi:hypothetical protein